jgi:hypothetical protein
MRFMKIIDHLLCNSIKILGIFYVKIQYENMLLNFVHLIFILTIQVLIITVFAALLAILWR